MEKEVRSPAAVACIGALYRAVYDVSIEPLRTAARGHGYALALHGSLARDIDLIAVPWTSGADNSELLMQTLRGALAGIFGRALLRDKWTDKPHGRKARQVLVWMPGEHIDFDFSVVPFIPVESDD